MFILEKVFIYGDFFGLMIVFIEWENKIVKFDFILLIVEGEEGLLGNWEYNWDLFDSEMIVCMNFCW